ncbi:hypothetical protein FW320_05490 [Azospirillum sp. Vi22]|uniref:hypothetical protein n=1 Tax=Azospirillum baldaniorum TaxID=1064539 RepID=UPI00157AF5ED|nr:hypothetical protein [Azospirillum baldaniorum]NUB05631.1 hypothetical protein [Azospirillum baldaniorum]
MWGPWAPAIDGTERAARCRCLGALVRVYAGPAAAPLIRALRAAEGNDNALFEAATLLDQLPARQRRGVLATYSALHDPRGPQ